MGIQRSITRVLYAAFTALITLLTACAREPMAPSSGHLESPTEAAKKDDIPAPVMVAPVLPKPKPSVRPETYSVVVNRVPAQELLFALARDANLQIDILPDVASAGLVTLNAINQTLPQLLDRISKQVDIRYEFDGDVLRLRRDSPYLEIYRIDYPNIDRTSTNEVTLSTQVLSGGATSGTAGAGATGSGGSNNSTTQIRTVTRNLFWQRLEQTVLDILNETDRNVPRLGVTTTAASDVKSEGTGAAGAQIGGLVAGTGVAGRGNQQVQGQSSVDTQAYSVREASRVFLNPEAGVLFVRARSNQHELVRRYVDNVMLGARRQVLVEATIAEVQLTNEYQRGIDWSRLRSTGSGLEIIQSSAGTPAGVSTGAFVIGYASRSLNFSAAIRLLESFGDVRVLSSPSISVLNNQTAVLKVVDNLVYFSIQGTQSTPTAGSPGVATFTTTMNSVPVGFIMSVVPQVSDSDAVTLNVRPTISRRVRDVPDPNPSLATAGVQNLIPVIQTREMESLLRVQSGQIAVLGGLMQDAINNTEDTLPGMRDIPLIGALFSQRRDQNTKTELVIFLRATVIRDPTVDEDYSDFRDNLPTENFFTKPNPGRLSPRLGPNDNR